MSKLTISSGLCNETGNKAKNDDACGILVPEEPLITNKGIAAVIADGVSSSEGGREASQACVKGFLADYFSTPDSWTVKTSGQRVLGALNRWLHGKGQHAFSHEHGMLTTFSAVVIKSATAHLFHVGDTRIYRLQNNDLECLTRDHQTWSSGNKSFLSRAMGADISLEIDYRSTPVEIADVFLLTTDGVHGHITHNEIKSILTEQPSNHERAAKLLVEKALENGSNDNVTCQIIKIDELPLQNEEEFYSQLTELPFPPSLEEGMILDGYKILHEIHSSKRTEVYLAVDTDNDEKVVLKIPSVNYEDDPEYIDQFLHEEWVGRRISRTNVLKVIVPTRRRRFLYYVTEYIEGQSLRQWMNDNPEPALNDVRNIIEQIAMGLRAFHRLEMLHQDIKPENIMIDAKGTVKIIDFGSTKIAGIQEINKPIDQNRMLGTLDFAAPEYFINEPASNRSDIYSLGVITYQMLTGGLPYGGPLTARTIQRVRYISARSFNKKIPEWVDSAIEKAVNINPQRRYSLLSELIHDLSHPNQDLISSDYNPLIKRNPVAFWQGFSIMLGLLNIYFLYLLSK